MSKNVKSGFAFGLSMTLYFILYNIYIDDSTPKPGILKNIIAALFSGTVAGIMYGNFIGRFSKRNEKKRKAENKDEAIN